eukprot:SAG31_NODE_21_length_34109_cov_60.598824_11_plen_73_part_00
MDRLLSSDEDHSEGENGDELALLDGLDEISIASTGLHPLLIQCSVLLRRLTPPLACQRAPIQTGMNLTPGHR